MKKLLLDTHTFIWWASDPNKLSKKSLALCEDRKNILFLSVASVWELQIKIQLGKIKLDVPLRDLIEEQIGVNDLQILKVDLEHILELENLADYHKDPFDRLLVAQSNLEDLKIVSKDSIIRKYTVNVIW